MRRARASQQTKPVTNSKKANVAAYNPPSSPKRAYNLATSYKTVPFILSISQEFEEKLAKAKDEQALLENAYKDPENFVVKVGHLKVKHLVDYEALYGLDLKVKLQRLQWLEFFEMLNATVMLATDKDKQTKEYTQAVKELETLKSLMTEDGDIVNTPYGAVSKNLEQEYRDIIIFILSCIGRITPDGSLEEIDTEDIENVLPADFMTRKDDDGIKYVHHILHLAGLVDSPATYASTPDPVEDQEDEVTIEHVEEELSGKE